MNQQDFVQLLQELNSRDEDRAWEAGERLWELDNPVHIPFLCNVIEHSRWDYIVDRAASRLVRIDGPKPIPLLFSAIERLWESYAPRYDIDSLLKNTGYAIAESGTIGTAFLLEQLKHANVVTRELAVLFLSFLDEQTALEPLLTALRSSDERRVRVMAVFSLGQLVGAMIESEIAFNALIEASYDPDHHVRGATISPLSLTCHPKAKEVLQRARNDESELVRQAATKGMERWRMNGCDEI